MDHLLQAKLLVAKYYNRKAEKTDSVFLTTDDVYVVWFCYILGGWKCLISTTVTDGMYYEVTYDKRRKATYIDAYKKWENVEVLDADLVEHLAEFP